MINELYTEGVLLDKQFGIVSEFDRQVAYTLFVGVCVCTCERVNV